MTFIPKIIGFTEENSIPDFALRAGIMMLVGKTRDKMQQQSQSEGDFAKQMLNFPIATHTDDANQQHYELPARFFELCLGANKKYSSCLFSSPIIPLNEAEDAALNESVKHADLKDGQAILELGCGWGSLTLFMARRFPNSSIVAVSNSHSQRQYIQDRVNAEGLKNVKIITEDMNVFLADTKFDRIVSVEMFEHMSNWHGLLARAKTWLKPDGLMFIHIFTHKNHSYRFDINDDADWIAKYFFAGGIMPSQNLIYEFGELFKVENHWRWNGNNYRLTSDAWLKNFDNNITEIDEIFAKTYGDDKAIWLRRWRLFFLATSGLFGFDNGQEWFVSHYLLRPT